MSSRAKYHLQIRPGTDGALALGMLNVIINEKLYDKEFVDNWCYGFDELKERVQQYPVDKVSEITWIPADLIVKAARLYATAKPGGHPVGGSHRHETRKAPPWPRPSPTCGPSPATSTCPAAT